MPIGYADPIWSSLENPLSFTGNELYDFVNVFSGVLPNDHRYWRDLFEFMPDSPVTFAVVPHIVSDIECARSLPVPSFYFLYPTLVEIARYKNNVEPPDFLKADYESAISELGYYAGRPTCISTSRDHLGIMTRLAAIAVSLKKIDAAEFLLLAKSPELLSDATTYVIGKARRDHTNPCYLNLRSSG